MACAVFSVEEVKSGSASFFRHFKRVIFLHDDFSELQVIEAALGREIETCGPLFHQVLESKASAILRVFEDFRSLNENEEIWDTTIASRNVASDSAVKNLTYLLCAKRISEGDGNSAFVVHSPALASLLSDLFSSSLSRRMMWGFRRRMRALRLFGKVLLRVLVFLARSHRIKWAVRRFTEARPLPNTFGYVLMRTWVTKGSLVAGDQGQIHFKDRNFGELASYFRRQGLRPVYLPMFFNLGTTEAAAFSQLASTGEKIFIPDQWLTAVDLWRLGGDALRLAFAKTRGIRLDGLDVSGLLREAHWQTHGSPALLRLQAGAAALKRLAQSAIRFQGALYPFENNPAEKPFLRAWRRAFESVPIVGFQHSVWYREQLSMLLSPDEVGTHPLPDRILCKGRIYLEVLPRLGFPKHLVHLGANLRFPEITGSLGTPTTGPSGFRLLVILTFSESHSKELLGTLGRALKILDSGPSEVQIAIKSHPLLNAQRILDHAQAMGLNQFEFVEGALAELIADSSAVLTVGGSVSALEALAIGVPLLRVSLSSDFDLDCIWDRHSFSGFTQSAAELARELQEILADPLKARRLAADIALKSIPRYFEPPLESALSVFLPTDLTSEPPKHGPHPTERLGQTPAGKA